jgi:hypothetical protein
MTPLLTFHDIADECQFHGPAQKPRRYPGHFVIASVISLREHSATCTNATTENVCRHLEMKTLDVYTVGSVMGYKCMVPYTRAV